MYDDLFKEVVSKINSGIPTENGIRPFDTIDLYYMVENVAKFANYMKTPSAVAVKDIAVFRQFLKKYYDGDCFTKSGIEILLNERREINCKKDKNGFPILGTGTVISREDIQGLILFMQEHNIPIKTKTYSAVLERYKNGIPLDNSVANNKVKIKNIINNNLNSKVY